VWVAGKTVIPLTCVIPECIRGGLRRCAKQITAHVCVHVIVHSCRTQNGSDNFPSYPPDSHRNSNTLSEGRVETSIVNL